MEKLRTLDLFSGIGGFTLGLDSTGYFETVAFCEIEAFPCKILNKHWPDVPIYNDVRELNHERLQTDGIISGGRRIDVICGGYPCQPFSVAGHQKGEADKRHLWPEYFRLVRELRPRYAIGENVGGHLRLGLDSVLEDLDSEDYTVRCFSVEAASLGAPHRRERIFWIADRNPNGSNVDQKQKVQERASAKPNGTCDDGTGKTMGNTECNGSSAPEIGEGNPKTPGRTAQGADKTLEPTGTGGSGDNEDVSDSGSGGTGMEIHRGGGQGRQRANPPESEILRQKDGTLGAERTGTGSKYVSDSESERHGGGHREERGTEQRIVLKAQQTGSEMGSETQGCGESSGTATDVADTASEGKWKEADQLRSQEESLSDKRRTRLWDGSNSSDPNVADTDNTGDRTPTSRTDSDRKAQDERRNGQSQSQPGGYSAANVADNRGPRGQVGLSAPGHGQKGNPEEPDYDCGGQGRRAQSNKAAFESYLGGGTDGLSSWLDGTWERGIPRVAPTDKARVPRLKALGNAVVPQLVYWVGMAVVLSTMREKEGDENGR